MKKNTSFTLYGERSEPSLELAPGYRFGGRFELVQHIGSGGFGQVWRVRDVYLDNDEIALKISGSELRNEIVTLRHLPKSHYIAVFDFAHDIGHSAYGYSMEFLSPPWMTLTAFREQVLAKQFENTATSLDAILIIICIAADILAGLEELHGNKYAKQNRKVHGDIKPANVYVNKIGAGDILKRFTNELESFTKIGDLGLTCEAGSSTRGGTPCYQAPEQGDSGTLVTQTDLFSVGKTITYLIFGDPAVFDESTHISYVRSALEEKIPSTYLVRRLAVLMRRLLYKNPGNIGVPSSLKQSFVDIIGNPVDWRIVRRLLIMPPMSVTKSDSANYLFNDVKQFYGWTNLNETRRAYILEIFTSLYKRDILERRGIKYDVLGRC